MESQFIVTNVQVRPITQNGSHVAFATVTLNDCLQLSNIAIHVRQSGEIRLVYPARKVGDREMFIFRPVERQFGEMIADAITQKYQEIMGSYVL